MANGNGHWVKWLVGTLFTISFFAITTLVTSVIANDKESRARDTKIEERVNEAILEQKQEMKEVAINVALIQKDIQYLIKALDK